MDLRFRMFLIVLIALLVTGAWTLPEWWIVLNPSSPAAEGLPGMDVEARVQFGALPSRIKEAYYTLYEGDEELELAPQPEWAVALAQARFLTLDSAAPENEEVFEAPANSRIVSTGLFTGIDEIRQARGAFTIYQDSTGGRLLRLEGDFYSSRAPDVHLVFTRNADPMDERGVGVDYIEVSLLKGNYGAQHYPVPSVVDFSTYPVLVLYSPTYRAILGSAALR